MPKSTRTLAQQIADLEDPTPKDVDPEAFGDALEHATGQDSDDESSDEEDDGRGHYEKVEKSKLRQPEQPLKLGKQYDGVKVSRSQALEGEESVSHQSDDSDNPFAAKEDLEDSSDDAGGEQESYVDPDTVDLNIQANDDEEIDSDDAFGDSDEEKFKSYRFRSSKSGKKSSAPSHSKQRQSIDDHDQNDEGVGKDDEGDSDSDSDSAAKDLEDSEDDCNGTDVSPDEDDSDEIFDSGHSDDESGTETSQQGASTADRAALGDMMRESQKAAVSKMAQGMKEDALKGAAVKRQRSTFDSLLNTRIRLQKALISTNSLYSKDTPAPNTPSDQEVIESAENAAISLFNALSALRESLPSNNKSTSKKRSFSASLDTTSKRLQEQVRSLDKASAPRTRQVLTKWSDKTQSAASMAAQSRISSSSNQALTSVLDSHMSGTNIDRHLSRVHTPRNCAPLQSESGVEEDTDIYDDADWYSLLLRDLVDSKMSASSDGAAAATSSLNGPTAESLSALRRENKQHRKGVDVKASKGRKMRYTVMEKLQNFMAPDNRGTWEQRQADELFAGLLGRKIKGGLQEDDGVGQDSEDDSAAAEVAGLRLFGGA